MTHGDKIRAMTDEELSEFLITSCADCPKRIECLQSKWTESCAVAWLNWLRQEVDEGEE